MDNVFTYELGNERIMRITYADHLFKWEVDIIENPEAHFKAEDDRRFGVYDYHFQSIKQVMEDPWHQEIPKNVHNQIIQYVEKTFSDNDKLKSSEKVKDITYSVWVPVEKRKS